MTEEKAIVRFDQPLPGTFSALKEVMNNPNVIERFEAILQDSAPEFIASLVAVTANNTGLLKCTPASLIRAATKAAILRLPIEPAIGLAHIVPFGNKAEFIPDYKGIINLCHRTGQFRHIHGTEIWNGEEVKQNRVTGETVVMGEKINDEVIGYLAHFTLTSGLQHTVYWTKTKTLEHAKKYSKAYQADLRSNKKNSPWSTETDKMGIKTVLKQCLKFAPKSIQWLSDPVQGGPASDYVIEEKYGIVEPDEYIETEFSDVDEEQQPFDELGEWWVPILDANLAKDKKHAENRLKLSELSFSSANEIMAWFRRYDGWKGVKPSNTKSATIAKLADSGELPR